jgi:hypothetical protein
MYYVIKISFDGRAINAARESTIPHQVRVKCVKYHCAANFREEGVLMHSLIFGKEGPPPSSSVRVLMRFTAPTENPLRARRRVGGQMPPPSRTC